MKDTYLSKVKKAWIPQLPHRLANTRIRVFIFDIGLKHLDNIILMGKETTLRILNDGAGCRHQPLASPMLWRWWLFRKFLSRSNGLLFRWTVVLLVTFPLSCPLTSGLRSWQWLPHLSFLFLFLISSNCPHPLSDCLHFYKGKRRVCTSDNQK